MLAWQPGPPARGHQTRLPTTQPQASNSSVSTVSRESQSRSWATSGFAGLHKGGGPRRHVHGGHHRRPAIAAPTLWGTVLPGLALATWCSAGWRDHPPESLSQKVASPHPTARQGPGVPPPPQRTGHFLPAAAWKVRTNHRACTAAARPGAHGGPPRPHLPKHRSLGNAS